MSSTNRFPERMTAIEIARPGGPEVLVATSRPLPTPGPREVLVEVRAAGVNGPDVLQRKGVYDPPPGASDIPGLEIAGTVRAVGSEVSRFAVGEAVMALIPGGGYAQFAVADERTTLHLPDGHPALAKPRRERRDHRRTGAPGLAARARRRCPAASVPHLPPGAGAPGPRTDGLRPAHRQDRPHVRSLKPLRPRYRPGAAPAPPPGRWTPRRDGGGRHAGDSPRCARKSSGSPPPPPAACPGRSIAGLPARAR